MAMGQWRTTNTPQYEDAILQVYKNSLVEIRQPYNFLYFSYLYNETYNGGKTTHPLTEPFEYKWKGIPETDIK